MCRKRWNCLTLRVCGPQWDALRATKKPFISTHFTRRWSMTNFASRVLISNGIVLWSVCHPPQAIRVCSTITRKVYYNQTPCLTHPGGGNCGNDQWNEKRVVSHIVSHLPMLPIGQLSIIRNQLSLPTSSWFRVPDDLPVRKAALAFQGKINPLTTSNLLRYLSCLPLPCQNIKRETQATTSIIVWDTVQYVEATAMHLPVGLA